MHRFILHVVGTAALVTAITSIAATAAVIGTNGSVSSAGTAAAIIAAPADANDDGAHNTGIQAFNEQQGYLLTSDLAIDGGTISKGTRVDSHMIFLNSGPGNSTTLIEHGFSPNSPAATFTFSGVILGVMSDSNGALEVASQFLGAAGTLYPGAAFSARGMENNPLSGTNDDYYSFAGDTITLGMRVTEPGDWIRVVTVSAVPVPAGLLLMGSALVGLGGLSAKRRRRKAA